MSQQTTTVFFDPSTLAPKVVTGLRLAFIVGGVVAIIVGIAILAWPGATLKLVGWLFGIFFIVAGVVRITAAVSAKGHAPAYRTLGWIFGILLLIAGVYVLFNPDFGAQVLAIVVGLGWIIEGVAAFAQLTSGASKWILVVYGIVSVAAGIVVIFLPLEAATVFLVVAAVLLIVAGVIQVIYGLILGRGINSSPGLTA